MHKGVQTIIIIEVVVNLRVQIITELRWEFLLCLACKPALSICQLLSLH